jgi:hypothetical protein
VIGTLTGHLVAWETATPLGDIRPARQMAERIAQALAADAFVMLGTRPAPAGNMLPGNLIPGHAHMVIGVLRDADGNPVGIRLYDPHGRIRDVELADLNQFNAVIVAGPGAMMLYGNAVVERDFDFPLESAPPGAPAVVAPSSHPPGNVPSPPAAVVRNAGQVAVADSAGDVPSVPGTSGSLDPVTDPGPVPGADVRSRAARVVGVRGRKRPHGGEVAQAGASSSSSPSTADAAALLSPYQANIVSRRGLRVAGEVATLHQILAGHGLEGIPHEISSGHSIASNRVIADFLSRNSVHITLVGTRAQHDREAGPDDARLRIVVAGVSQGHKHIRMVELVPGAAESPIPPVLVDDHVLTSQQRAKLPSGVRLFGVEPRAGWRILAERGDKDANTFELQFNFGRHGDYGPVGTYASAKGLRIAILREDGTFEVVGSAAGTPILLVEVRRGESVQFFDTVWTGDAPPDVFGTVNSAATPTGSVAGSGAYRQPVLWVDSGVRRRPPTARRRPRTGPVRRRSGAASPSGGGEQHTEPVPVPEAGSIPVQPSEVFDDDDPMAYFIWPSVADKAGEDPIADLERVDVNWAMNELAGSDEVQNPVPRDDDSDRQGIFGVQDGQVDTEYSHVSHDYLPTDVPVVWEFDEAPDSVVDYLPTDVPAVWEFDEVLNPVVDEVPGADVPRRSVGVVGRPWRGKPVPGGGSSSTDVEALLNSYQANVAWRHGWKVKVAEGVQTPYKILDAYKYKDIPKKFHMGYTSDKHPEIAEFLARNSIHITVLNRRNRIGPGSGPVDARHRIIMASVRDKGGSAAHVVELVPLVWGVDELPVPLDPVDDHRLSSQQRATLLSQPRRLFGAEPRTGWRILQEHGYVDVERRVLDSYYKTFFPRLRKYASERGIRISILRVEGNIEVAGPETGVDMFWVEVRNETSVNFFDTTWTGDAPPPAPETPAPVVRTISRVARAGAPRRAARQPSRGAVGRPLRWVDRDGRRRPNSGTS